MFCIPFANLTSVLLCGELIFISKSGHVIEMFPKIDNKHICVGFESALNVAQNEDDFNAVFCVSSMGLCLERQANFLMDVLCEITKNMMA